MIKAAIVATLLGVGSAMGSTKAVYPVWQALSLHGTDVTSVPGIASDVEFGVIMSKPMVVSGALPEGLIYGVAASHRMQVVGPQAAAESNLLTLYNIRVDPEMTETGLVVVFDLSGLKIPADMEVGVRDAIRLGIEAIKNTLQNYAEAHLHRDLACSVSVEGLTAKNQSFRGLGQKFVIRVPARGAIEREVQLPEAEE